VHTKLNVYSLYKHNYHCYNTKQNNVSEILGLDSGVLEDLGILGCDAVLFCEW